MSFTSNLPLEYHQQDTNFYCGAACALMVLHHLGAGHLSEVDLYNDNHSHSVIEANWASGPDGLEWTMNNRNPSTQQFDLIEMGSEDEVSREIAWSIHNAGVAPIALVYGFQHWITVIGFDASQAPQSNTDAGFSITAFHIHNPWPPTPPDPVTGALAPHTTGDSCGSGGNFGIANEHISYNTWQNDYMTGVPAGHWLGKFLAVCAPTATVAGSGKHQKNMKRKVSPRPSTLISKEKAAELAMSFSSVQLRGAAGARSVPPVDTKEEPALIRRLDRENEYYYLVPVGVRGGGVSSIISLDGHTGDYKQSIETGNRGSEFSFKPFSTETIGEAITSLRGNDKELIKKSRSMLEVEQELVWKPCLESFSPYWPFQKVSLGDTTIYIRVDGQIFYELTTSLAGA